ncbi:MAG: two-component sensor histidine kinase, partial [Stellaceae bacterium]
MRSSPIDLDDPALASGPAEEADAEPRSERDIRPHGWVKRVLPRTMFGRSLLIVVMPLILLQAIATWVFYDRHWAAVSWRLASGVAGDIALTIDALKLAPSPAARARLLGHASAATDMDFAIALGERLPPPAASGGSLAEEQLTQAMLGRTSLPYRVDTLADPYRVQVKVGLAQGVLTVDVPRNRLYSSTTYIFVMWMVGSSLVLLAVATLFLRNQVKSLRRLAAAAESFGKGRPVPFFKVEG